MKKLNYNFCSLTIIAFLYQIILSLLLENNQNLIDDIIIFENTNGDIYLAQDIDEVQLYFGTTSSSKEYRIFYGLKIDREEKYIFQDKDTGEYIPYIKKNIDCTENKEIYNAGLAVLTMGSKTYLLLIGTNDSYIEQLNVNNYSENLNLFLPSEFFVNNTINKGVSPLIISYRDYIYYMFSSTLQDDPYNYFISFLQLYFSIPSEAGARLQYKIDNFENFNNIKGDYMSCFGFPIKIYYSCFYLDVDNKYKISFIVYQNDKFIQKEPIEIYSPSNINDDEFIFLKGVGFTDSKAVYAYYSGEENNIPTLMFKTIDISETNLILNFSNTYADYEAVYLYDYNFNNGIKYNDLLVNEYTKKYSDAYFVSTHINKEFIIIAHLIFYISSSTSKYELLIKYYTIQLKDYYNIKIFHGLKAINFNNIGRANRYLSLAFDFCLLDTCDSMDEDKGNAALMVFSYPNKTYDKNLDFIEYAFDYNRQYVIANLSENFIINNNIFGYYIKVVQINDMIDDCWDIEEEDEDGIIYYYEKTHSRVDLYCLTFEEALIRVDLTKYNFEELQYNNIYINYYIELFPMEDLEKLNSFCDKINDTFGNKSDDNSIGSFTKYSIYSTFNININEKMSSNCSDTNCSLCLKNDSNYCIVCKDDNYTIILDEKFIYGKYKLCQKEEKVVTESTEITEFTEITEITEIKAITEIPEKITDIESSIFNNNDEQSTIVESEKIVDSERSIIDDLLNNKYIDINLSNEEIKNVYEEIKKNLKENYDGNDVVIRTNNVKIQISSLGAQINSDDISNIDLGECGEKLKLKYCKTENDSLIILKFDIKPENATSTFVKYEVYEPYSNSEIDLEDECPEQFIIIDIPIELEPEMELMYDLLSKSGYNLFNPNSSFYNDICATYTTENGTDILLYDRRMDIYQSTVNISLCQKGCEFHSYEKEVKKAKCQCSATSAASIDKLDLSDVKFEANIMLDKFKQVLQNSNFRVLKCYNLLLKFNLLIKNIGFIIMTLLLLIFIALLIIYKLVSYKRISLYIKEIIDYNSEQKKEKEKEKEQLNKNNDNLMKHKLNGENTSTNTNSFISSDKRKIISRRINKINNADNKNLLTSVNVKYSTNKLLIDSHKKCDSNYLHSKDINDKVGNKENFINGNNIEIFKRPVATRINTPIEEEINKNEENFEKKGKKEINHIKSEIDRKISDKQLYPNKVEDNAKIKELNEQEMNSLEYEEAIRLDKRNYFQYYISLLKKKQLIIFTFFNLNDYNILSIKISLFLVSFSLYLSINGFFFNDKSMHKIYKENGAFNIINQIPQVFYSSVTSTVINMILKLLSLSEKDILKIKNEKNEKECLNNANKIEKCIKIKFIIFFIISLILMAFFWYFISCFCAVYTNTQIILFKDTFLSFALSMIYPFGINLLPGLFRIPSLRSEKKDKKCFYSLSKILALF